MVGSPHGSAPELSDSAIQNKTFSLTNAHKKQLGVSFDKRDKLTCVSKLRQLQGPSDQPFSWPFSCSVVYTPFYKTSRSTTHLNHPAGQIDSQGLTPQLVERDPLLTAGCQLPQVLKYNKYALQSDGRKVCQPIGKGTGCQLPQVLKYNKYAIQSDGGQVCQPMKIGDPLLTAGGQLPQVLKYNKYAIQSDSRKVCQPMKVRDPLLAAGCQLPQVLKYNKYAIQSDGGKVCQPIGIKDQLLTAGCQLPQVLKYKYAIQSDGGKVCQPIKIGDSLLVAGGQLPQVLTYKYTIQSDGGKVCQPIGIRDPLLAAGVQLRHSEKMPSDELMGTLSGIMLIADLNPNYYLKIW